MIKILILGGGFGGVRCALNLRQKLKNPEGDKQFDITLIDRNCYHLFTPDVYEVATAYGLKKDPYAVQLKKTVCMPYADIFANKDINFMEAEVTNIDTEAKKVTTGGEHVLDYDYLIMALGGESSDFGITGVRDYAHQFKTLDDVLFINQSLQELTEQFMENKRTEPFSFIICGAGFTGIELAAELGSYSKVLKRSCKLKNRCSTITLFEAGPKMLPMVSDKERNLIKKRLTDLGVIIMENSPIEEVGPNFVKLKSGLRTEGDLIIWTAGIKPAFILSSAKGLTLSAHGKIPVDQNLKAQGSDNIFGIGDNVELIDPKTQKPVPALSYVAIDQAKIAAENIYRTINNKKTKNYKPFYSVWVVPIGGKFALAHLWGGLRFNGIWGWIVRQLIDIRYLLSLFSIKKTFEIYLNEITIFSKND